MLLLCLMLASASWLMAQTGRVTGKVTDASTGSPVEGATITVKGTGRSAVSSTTGIYTIAADRNSVLVVSSSGYSAREITVSGDVLDIALDVQSQQLTDVVVVGYGTQRRSSLTGAVSVLKNEDLTRRQVSSATQVLQGLAPGLTVQQQSGRPGADGAFVRIRGESSIQGNSSPLVVIDGLLLPTGTGLESLNQIDPNVIESITVLKDAASTAIYGNRASSGVIVVKTKRATQPGMKLSYNNFFSKQSFTSLPKRVNAVSHMELSNVAEQNRTGNPAAVVFPQTLIDKYKTTAPNNLDVIDTDWLGEVLTNSGMMQNHNVQLTAGGEKFSMFSSFTYFNQKGLIQNNQFERFDIRLNPEFKVAKWLTLIGNLGFTDNETVNPSTGSPEFIIRQAIGLPAIGGGIYGPGQYGTAAQSNNRNPIAMAEATGNSVTKGNTMLTRFGFNLHPVSGLEIEGYWGREKRNPYTKTFIKNADIYQPNLTTQTYDKISVWPGNTQLSEAWRNDIYQTWLGQATYGFRTGDHAFKIMGGAQSELYSNYFFGASRQGFINPNQPYLNLGTGARDNSSGVSELALVGFFGRFNYAFRDIGVNRCTSTTPTDNHRDIKFIEGIGFTREGVMVEAYGDKARYLDHEKAHRDYLDPQSPLRDVAAQIDTQSEAARAFKALYARDTGERRSSRGASVWVRPIPTGRRWGWCSGTPAWSRRSERGGGHGRRPRNSWGVCPPPTWRGDTCQVT
jgi:TonB-linked SusC/RagA family outer membrane protein